MVPRSRAAPPGPLYGAGSGAVEDAVFFGATVVGSSATADGKDVLNSLEFALCSLSVKDGTDACATVVVWFPTAKGSESSSSEFEVGLSVVGEGVEASATVVDSSPVGI